MESIIQEGSQMSVWSKLEKIYEKWHGKSPKSLIEIDIPDLELGTEWLVLGKLPEIMYRSAKYENEVYQYRHKFKKQPFLLTDPAGKVLLIVGGNFTITERGIVG